MSFAVLETLQSFGFKNQMMYLLVNNERFKLSLQILEISQM